MSELVDKIQVLERPTRVCPLGIRFWDGVTQTVIRDSLTVVAYPQQDSTKRTRSVPNLSGFHTFHNLPGLAEFERGRGDAEFWAKPHPQRPFVVQVIDEAGRFLPIRMDVSLPIRIPRVIEPPAPADFNAENVTLFSAPARSIPAGMAAIRADLRDVSGRPAAWALLEADVPGQPPVRGLSDSSGRVLLLFPYPEPADIALGSPLGGTTAPLVQQKWTVHLQARYRPVQPIPTIPQLRDILNQPAAELQADNGSPAQRLTEATLAYGRELIVGSVDSITATPLSHLLISSAA